MKWFWLYVLLAVSAILRCSQDSSASDSTPDQLCDMAVINHVPVELRQESFKIRPYLRQLIEEEQSGGTRHIITTRESFPSIPFGEQKQEYCPSPHSPLPDLIVRAYHKALLEKEADLHTREQALVLAEHKLSKKMSKSATAGWSALTGLLTSVITLIITIVSQK